MRRARGRVSVPRELRLLEIHRKDRLLKPGMVVVDLVIFDMAPNMNGMSDIDQPRAMYLVELAVDFAMQMLRPGGALLMKLFQGEDFTELLSDLKRKFDSVVNRKSEASRSRSRKFRCWRRIFSRLVRQWVDRQFQLP